MKRLLVYFLVICTGVVKAQQIRPSSSPDIYNDIQQLRKLASVLYFAAHPDDENTRLLAWLVKDQHIPTAYLSLTRGDGGQNILGSEQGAALGLIRTHELLAARKLDGASQYFTRAIDFGFSKTAAETFQHWSETQLTKDAVRIIRRYRPDVIICRFPPDKRAGHGQHAASAIIAAAAFKKAGKNSGKSGAAPGSLLWQPKRILWNTYRFGRINTTDPNQFKIRVGNYSPLLGMGYGELAGISRSLHKSQGAGTPSIAGIQDEYFELVDGDTMTHSLFDGIDITWNRVGRPDIDLAIKKILEDFDFTEPSKSLPALLSLRLKIQSVKDDHWRTTKLRSLDKIILSAAGFMAEATTQSPTALAGEKIAYTLSFIARPDMVLDLSTASNSSTDTVVHVTNIVSDSLYSLKLNYSISPNQPLTQPYWLIEPPHSDLYTVLVDSLIGLPETPNTLTVPLTVQLQGQRFDVQVPLSFKKLDPLKGDIVEQLRIVPAVTLEPYAALLLADADGTVRSSVRLHAYKDVPGTALSFYADGQRITTINGMSLKAQTDTIIAFHLTKEQMSGFPHDYTLSMKVEAAGETYDKSLHLIQYSHLPTLQYFSTASTKVLRNDWKTTAKTIGFVEGAGDYTVTLLRLSGLTVDVLSDAQLSNPSSLARYDAIVTGVRALNVEKRMSYWMPSLLNYVKNGGTLVMQYNTLQDLATDQFGPYPFKLSSKRVTEENAPVKVLQPSSPLLNHPNKISASDWDNWVQERGLYFADDWDLHYQTLFQMHDTDEPPLDGATIYTPYGKGQYIYTSLSFFRQFPAGNRGAIRLFMNMLSAGK